MNVIEKHLYFVLFMGMCLKIEGIRNENKFTNKTDGIFVEFLRNYFDLLSTSFPEKKLIKYCKILSSCLEGMDYSYAQKLYRHVKRLSRKHRSEIKEDIVSYRHELDKELPYRTDFLSAMNEIFTLRERIVFSDYIYDLRDFGNEDKFDIYEETHKILYDVILGSVKKFNSKDRYKIVKKLKKAIKEYKANSD